MSTSQQFKITEASISADRFGGFASNSFDVRTSVAELNIFESLDKPYLTGTVVILDDKALFDSMNFQGTERFRIKLSSADETLDTVFERTFMMTGIERSVKSNDNGKSSMYVITLLDEHAYLSSLTRISKSFNGRIDKIIIKLLATQMNMDVDVSYLFRGDGKESLPVQSNMKGIIPNLSPIQTIKWLIQRATTVTGSPFFAYASMHDDNLRLGNLDAMLSQKAFNSKLPYTYNPANVSSADTQSEVEKTFTIKALKTSKMGNTLKLIQEGAVSSQMSNTNLNTGQIFSQHFSIRNTLNKLNNHGIIGEYQNVFDTEFKMDESLVDTFESQRFHTITSSGTYGRFKSYHDEFDATKFEKKLESKALHNTLYKNMMNVVIEGAGFIVSKASVGDIVNLKIVNDNTEQDRNVGEDDLIDKTKSGDCIIYDTRHTFSGTQHTVSMNVCKLEKLS